MILKLVISLAGLMVVAIVGWCSHRWHCQRTNPSCPTWQQQYKRGWKARLRKRYGHSSYERHPTPPAERIDPTPGSGVPHQQRDAPTAETKPSNPKRNRP